MRLLNAKTKELKRFLGDEIPPYAILSHTWGKEEVVFSDIISMSFRQIRRKAGSAKITYTCNQAINDGYEYVWIDTCCIDKSSSAELSEAINSMYQWYSKSAVCYAYLEDVPLLDFIDFLPSSRWFTRGWTLQELIAPTKVIFYGLIWARLGSKDSLIDVISKTTGIDRDTLWNPRTELFKTSVASRMSWASKRKTTRPEDAAYSLLGIFDVNMPLLYGEGNKAFIRLQEEIMKRSNDQTLFAWGNDNIRTLNGRLFDDSTPSVFAETPMEFQNSGEFVKHPHTPPYLMTNKGLEICLAILSLTLEEARQLHLSDQKHALFADNEIVMGLLNCHPKQDYFACIGIFLYKTMVPNTFTRVRSLSPVRIPFEMATKAKSATIYIHQGMSDLVLDGISNLGFGESEIIIWLKAQSLHDHGFRHADTARLDSSINRLRWNEANKTVSLRRQRLRELGVSFMFYDDTTKQGFAVILSSPAVTNIGWAVTMTEVQVMPSWSHSHANFSNWINLRDKHKSSQGQHNDRLSYEMVFKNIRYSASFEVTSTVEEQIIFNRSIFILTVQLRRI